MVSEGGKDPVNPQLFVLPCLGLFLRTVGFCVEMGTGVKFARVQEASR